MASRRAKPRESQASIARRHGIEQKTIGKWKRAGLDIYDDAEVARWALAKRAGGKNAADQIVTSDGEVEDYGTARTRKERAMADRAEIARDRERGHLIARAEVNEMMRRLGAVVAAGIRRFEADLPPMLAGMNEPKMQREIRGKVDEVMAALADAKDELWRDDTA